MRLERSRLSRCRGAVSVMWALSVLTWVSGPLPQAQPLSAGTGLLPPATGIGASLGRPVIDPLLSEVLRTTDPAQPIEAVLTFFDQPAEAELSAIEALGVQVAPFRVLPMVGIRGTPSQIVTLYSLSGLRSVSQPAAVVFSR